MIQAILTCISIVILFASWYLYRRNIELFVCLLIVIYSELFYLVPQIHQGPDDYKLLLLPIVLILIFESLVTGKLSLGRYGWWVISFLGISLFGVIVACFFGQSLELGIKAAKFIPLVMVYFLLAGRKINAEKFTNYFIVMGLAVGLIASFQYFMHDSINLFPGLPREGIANIFERAATYRITVGQFVIPVAVVAAFARFRQSNRLMYMFAVILLFLEVLFIQQTRVLIAALFLSLFVVYVLSNRLTAIRISAYLIVAGIGLTTSLLLSASDFYSISLVSRTKTDFEKRRGSYQARINAYNHYWQEIQKHPVTGYGILNFNWEGNSEQKLQKLGMHLSDIGIIHYFVQAALIGFIWFGYGLIKIWLDIVSFREQLLFSSYFIIATFTMPTIDMFLRNDSLFLFALFLGLSSALIATLKSDSVVEGS